MIPTQGDLAEYDLLTEGLTLCLGPVVFGLLHGFHQVL